MVAVAARIGLTAKPDSPVEQEARAFQPLSAAACRFEPSGKLHLTSRCAIVLAIVGLLVGILSGLFGVGGGFVVVPALVLLTGMEIHRAGAMARMHVSCEHGMTGEQTLQKAEEMGFECDQPELVEFVKGSSSTSP